MAVSLYRYYGDRLLNTIEKAGGQTI